MSLTGRERARAGDDYCRVGNPRLFWESLSLKDSALFGNELMETTPRSISGPDVMQIVGSRKNF